MAQTNIKDFTSLYKIKEFLASKIAPQYFDIQEIDTTNVGLFGYVTEALGDNAEDSFFATSMMFKEIFPVTAEDPESIYLMASIFQMDNHYATPSLLGLNILISEEDVIKKATFANGFYTLHIDRDMVINVDGIPFMLDYDIALMSAESGTETVGGQTYTRYTHTARYILDSTFNNSISDINSPYIPTRVHRHTENGKRYVLMTVYVHQVAKTVIEDVVLSNDRINLVSKEYDFTGQIANFEIFYRESDVENWRQMKKYLANSAMVSTDECCYYKFINDGKLGISFNTDDRYFIPAFNSQLKVEIYTTLGKDGNFTDYKGEELTISAVSTKYESNKGLIFIGNVRGGASGGYNAKSLDELKIEVIKSYSTVKSFTTANDLTLYFNNLRLNQNNELLFLKQRDDALKRLFSAFVLFKDKSGNVVPTNTVDILYHSILYDASYVQSNRFVLNAGKLYKFRKGSRYITVPCDDLTLNSDLDKYEETENIYINPFLTVIGISPAMVGYYINTINDNVDVEYRTINNASFNQFVVNSLEVHRNALAGENTYKLKLKLYPTSQLPTESYEVVNDDDRPPADARTFYNEYDGLTYVDKDVIKCIMKFDEVVGYYVPFRLTGFDDECYWLTAELTTNDFISLNNKFAITKGLYRLPNGRKQTQEIMVKCYDTPVTIYTFLNYEGSTTAGVHPYSMLQEFSTCTLTNEYGINKGLSFIIPVSEIISTLKYEENDEVDKSTFDAWLKNSYVNMDDIHSKEEFDRYQAYFNRWRMLMNADDRPPGKDDDIYLSHDESIAHPTTDYNVRIMSVPMVKANIMKTSEDYNEFLDNFRNMYAYLKRAMESLTNNFEIDLKFFNTYGPSRHFYYDDNHGRSDLMDKVNIKLHFGVKFNITNGVENAVASLKEYITTYVESDEISLINAPSLYISNLIQSIINDFESVAYVTFKGLNSYNESVQKFESEINDINVLEGSFATNDVVPEYLTIDTVITKTIKTPQIIIDVL